MGDIVVYANKGRRDVGLLVEMGEPEARKSRGVVYNGGLVFGTKACREGIPRLRAAAVDTIDERGDGSGCRAGG